VGSGVDILNATSLSTSKLAPARSMVERVFHLPATIFPVSLDFPRAYDVARCQYNSTALLSEILQMKISTSSKRIALVDVDLFIPVLTFVFGEAQLLGTAAVVSTHRLASDFYGLVRDEHLMLERLEKEMIHELGHTFGLLHCRQFECVMRSSTYVEEIDLKRVLPCRNCDGLISSS
jgi:archaemetzincin